MFSTRSLAKPLVLAATLAAVLLSALPAHAAVWIPGHIGPGGRWIPGHYAPGGPVIVARPGVIVGPRVVVVPHRVWIGPRVVYGRWHPGYWR